MSTGANWKKPAGSRRSEPRGGAAVIANETALKQSVEQLSSPDILVDCRIIAAGDETALLLEEAESIASHAPHVRRASGAARVAGRALLARLGFPDRAIPKASSGAPVWPKGLLGSFAHDDEVAVAAVARTSDIAALGIDIEPAEPLPAELQALVLTTRERAQLLQASWSGRLVFATKEAVYKAIAALDGTLLDYQDIETDLSAARATADGRCLTLRYSTTPRLIVLAFIERA
jgi:4'-phosphopantetheinyl transferase EntD